LLETVRPTGGRRPGQGHAPVGQLQLRAVPGRTAGPPRGALVCHQSQGLCAAVHAGPDTAAPCGMDCHRAARGRRGRDRTARHAGAGRRMTARSDASRRQAASPGADAGPSGRRVFFALWPDRETAGLLSGWARHAHAAFGGRIMRADTLHLTLAFLGSVPHDRVAELAALLDEAELTGGTLRLDRYGRFRGPQIVWA